ncbi:hypothetical protein TorRG33x02_270790 [Trema orientale]|uniref:Uncharacterized protein n=1 Tax=Trema orientale TaxID=63057 RepID=A0A2P5CWN6_TREOI|nr:hypothetical protein TorRG33x02_270790 [Trema orientale]
MQPWCLIFCVRNYFFLSFYLFTKRKEKKTTAIIFTLYQPATPPSFHHPPSLFPLGADQLTGFAQVWHTFNANLTALPTLQQHFSSADNSQRNQQVSGCISRAPAIEKLTIAFVQLQTLSICPSMCFGRCSRLETSTYSVATPLLHGIFYFFFHL